MLGFLFHPKLLLFVYRPMTKGSLLVVSLRKNCHPKKKYQLLGKKKWLILAPELPIF